MENRNLTDLFVLLTKREEEMMLNNRLKRGLRRLVTLVETLKWWFTHLQRRFCQGMIEETSKKRENKKRVPAKLAETHEFTGGADGTRIRPLQNLSNAGTASFSS